MDGKGEDNTAQTKSGNAQRFCLGPSFPCFQKITLYETRARLYLIGSNNDETSHGVIKIDRTERRELVLTEDKMVYDARQLRELLVMIDSTSKTNNKPSGLRKLATGCAIFGFVRFLEGYYIILITNARKVALIGCHSVYKVEDTVIIPIPNDSVRVVNSDESRYLKIFQNVDTSSNFYFSYTYDLTNTLQYNMQLLSHISIAPYSHHEIAVRMLEANRRNYCSKFVWNHVLLQPIIDLVNPDWVLPVIHGYIEQSNVSVYCCPVYVTLIARRSCCYAGTRYLKRGANDQGNVANEVETEHTTHIATTLVTDLGQFTSYVSMRGSVPCPWSQEASATVPKPSIKMDKADPYASMAAQHFNELFARYGTPVVVLNLVKEREKRKRERILSEQLQTAVKYLNQFLPPDHYIHYVAWDMAKFAKSHQSNVIDKLEQIAEQMIHKTGYFHNGRGFADNELHSNSRVNVGRQGYSDCVPGREQTGIVRVNCVDCVDRTNTAQFMIHKRALGYQLYTLGIISSPHLPFDTDLLRMFEEMFENHGDTIAQQYGGSHLVHRIRTYRHIATPWALPSRDMLQSVSRYYSNAFTDNDKQMAINLFVGAYQPHKERLHLWELTTDYYLHHLLAADRLQPEDLPGYTNWCHPEILDCLPLPLPPPQLLWKKDYKADDEMKHEAMDSFTEYYQPLRLTLFEEDYCCNMPRTRGVSDSSPFVVKDRKLVRQSGEASQKVFATTQHRKSTEDITDSGEDGSDDEPAEKLRRGALSMKSSVNITKRKDIDPFSCKNFYGLRLRSPDSVDAELYDKYCLINYLACHAKEEYVTKENIQQHATTFVVSQYFTGDSTQNTVPPGVSLDSLCLYEDNVRLVPDGPQEPSRQDKLLYEMMGW
ncbi:polyphosphoinositide phosphatase-like [Corticium candelabrum]|uniref:polyphosphoinositide phosphatase-like n=1 Tax=Corticium candelabrum TaxID=121492 RepID=UPI002E2726C0|nr:polyphosphoinositide phosphatase-like [Corticium candelabrum]